MIGLWTFVDEPDAALRKALAEEAVTRRFGRRRDEMEALLRVVAEGEDPAGETARKALAEAPSSVPR